MTGHWAMNNSWYTRQPFKMGLINFANITASLTRSRHMFSCWVSQKIFSQSSRITVVLSSASLLQARLRGTGLGWRKGASKGDHAGEPWCEELEGWGFDDLWDGIILIWVIWSWLLTEWLARLRSTGGAIPKISCQKITHQPHRKHRVTPSCQITTITDRPSLLRDR